jgi:beta-glucuronidase
MQYMTPLGWNHRRPRNRSSARAFSTAEFLDVLGVNNYAGWYANKADYFAKLLDHVHAQLKGVKPLVVTEFGAEGILGQRSLEMHPWTEDYQAELLVRHIGEVLKRDFVAGFFIWLFIDYEAASISIRAINAKGLVDEYRRPKLALNEVKRLLEQWASAPLPGPRRRDGEGGET